MESDRKITGAIFDMDGVLFDTERMYQDIWQQLARERHVTLGSGFVRTISGTTGNRMRQVVEEYYQVSDGDAVIRECMARIREQLSVHVPVKEGVREILHFLKEKGIPAAVASSSSTEQIEANLRKSGIRDTFASVVSGTEVKAGKPAPDIFLCAAERIGCRPEECVVFEDSENGIRAGHAAGCITFMIPDLIAPGEDIRPYCSRICGGLTEARKELENLTEAQRELEA